MSLEWSCHAPSRLTQMHTWLAVWVVKECVDANKLGRGWIICFSIKILIINLIKRLFSSDNNIVFKHPSTFSTGCNIFARISGYLQWFLVAAVAFSGPQSEMIFRITGTLRYMSHV